MAKKSDKIASLLQLLTYCGTAATVGISAGYYFGRDTMASQVAMYEKSSEWKLPETLKGLTKVNEQLEVTLLKTEELNKLKTERDALRAQVRELEGLSNRITSLSRELAAATNTLSQLQGDTIIVPQGQARPFGHKTLMLGVTRVAEYLNYAEVHFSGKEQRLTVGAQLEGQADGKTYLITLIKLGSSDATFALSLKQGPPK